MISFTPTIHFIALASAAFAEQIIANAIDIGSSRNSLRGNIIIDGKVAISSRSMQDNPYAPDPNEYWAPPPIESYCTPDNEPTDGSSCGRERLVCAYNNFSTQCRCSGGTWSCGAFSPLPTPPVPPPTPAPVPCKNAADCAGSIYMLDGSAVQFVEEVGNEEGSAAISTEADEFGLVYDPEAAAAATSGMEGCVPYSLNDGSFVCTFRTILPIPSRDTNTITDNNRECTYSPAMQSTICTTIEAMGDVSKTVPENNEKIVLEAIPESLPINTINEVVVNPETQTQTQTPPEQATDTVSQRFDSNNSDLPPGPTGTSVGDCPECTPKSGESCVEYVQVGSPQRSCHYNNIQCNCALQGGISQENGWSCRDVGMISF